MQALRIAARVPAGLVASDPWSPAIDGVLAWSLVRERVGLDAMALTPDAEMAPVTDLPLERAECDGLWWYCCSIPEIEAAARSRVHLHRRFDRQAGEAWLTPAVKRLGLSAGAYKDRRMPRVLSVTGCVTWHAIGDAAEVLRLLRGVTHLGRDRARGRGEVAGWTGTPAGGAVAARRRRPLPVAAAARLGLSGPTLPWGLHPPARLHRVPCVMPAP